MLAIIKREFNAYFASPIGYVFVAVFYILAGFFFIFGVVVNNTTNMSPVFTNLLSYSLMLIPLLTMRLMSEDKRQKTDQALLTAPISLFSIVMGKFLAALITFILGLSITVVFALTMDAMASIEWALFIGNFLGFILAAGAFTAIGVFISSLTENQLIAAVATLVVSALFMFMNSIASSISNEMVSNFVGSLSLYNRYQDFTLGMINVASVIYFFSIMAVFLFLTVRVLEKRRWG